MTHFGKWLVCFSFFIFSFGFAQQKSLTIDQAVLGLSTEFAPEKWLSVSWLPDGQSYSYINSTLKNQLMIYDCKKNTSTVLLEKKELSVDIPNMMSLGKVYWKTSNEFYFIHQSQCYLVNVKEKKTTPMAQLPSNADHITWSSKLDNIYFTLEKDLAFMPVNSTDKPTIIAMSQDPNITYGQTVSRNEYGIDGGIFVSPQGQQVAYYKKDESEVKSYPIVNWSKTPAEVKMIKYPMAGEKSEQVTLWIYNTRKKTNIKVNIEAPNYHYITCVSWSPDEKNIYAAILNRSTTSFALNQYDATTGAFVKTITTETSEKYVEPSHILYFLSDNEFVYQSNKSGYNHLYLYNLKNNEFKTITQGDWQVNTLLGHDTKTKKIYFTATKQSPLEEHIYSTSYIEPNVQLVDQNDGWHTGNYKSNGYYLIDEYSSHTVPYSVKVWDLKSKSSKLILANKSKLDAYQLATVEPVELFAEDGTKLHGKLIYKTNIDKTKKYPTIVYLYNGPHIQLNTNKYPASGNLWYDYLADQGYVVFVMDGRGSGNRGIDFEQATFRQLGTVEMKDQMKGMEFLRMVQFVDSKRVGVHGWSFGGFMTTNLLLTYPHIFKAGVAGGPVMDWGMYEVMYTERYMDTPEENPEGYAKSNLTSRVDQLKDHLLVIHGTDDDVVVWQQSIKFIKECVNKNIAVDYFAYPGHPHNVRGKDRVHLMQKVTDYFNLYLKN